MAKTIPLTRGYVAIVDDADYDWLTQWSWHYKPVNAWRGYAVRSMKRGGKHHRQRMHRAIMGVEHDPTIPVDHANGNTLDNRRENLRLCTHAENLRNSQKHAPGSSIYKGVWHQPGTDRPWRADIYADGRKLCIGRFATEQEAAIAYDEAALKHYGEFARLNFPNPPRGTTKEAREERARRRKEGYEWFFGE